MSTPLRFDCFEVDLAAGRLLKHGIRIHLREQSFRVLELLLAHPGDVVTREDLRRVLWPADVFVDFENNLNAAVARLREALGDSAEQPRFIETLPKRGYRFIAPVTQPAPVPEAAPPKRVRSATWVFRVDTVENSFCRASSAAVEIRVTSRDPEAVSSVIRRHVVT
jgi:DNA-binding winged helix-turn-helix (wHTH) protein